MTAHKIQLQVAQLMPFDSDVGKLAEAGVDTVNSATFVDYLLDDRPRRITARTGSR